MRIRRFVVMVTCVAAALSVEIPGAWAADGPGGSGGGSLGPSTIGANADANGGSSGTDPIAYTSSAPNPAPSTYSSYVWVDVGADLLMTCVNGQPVQGNGPPGPNGPGTGQSLGPPGAAGFPDLWELVGPSQAVVATRDVCPGTAAPAVAAPPPPPTPAEVWAATPLPGPHFHFNPSTLGLTQLPTWFWLTGVGGGVDASVAIRGYTVTTTAHPAAYYWTFGDGGSSIGAAPGSEEAPSAVHNYVTKGSYQVAVTVGWVGQFTFAGNGVPPETVQLGTVDGPTSVASYGVQEIRSVGVQG